MRVAGPFGVPVPEYLSLLRLHLPLIEPDGRISRIRLSDKNSHLRPRKVSRTVTQADEAEFVMQPRVGEP